MEKIIKVVEGIGTVAELRQALESLDDDMPVGDWSNEPLCM